MTNTKTNDYSAPLCKVIEVSAQNIICQSGGNNGMNEDYYGNGGFHE